MAKMTDGWLCRDTEAAEKRDEAAVVFYPGEKEPQLGATGVWSIPFEDNLHEGTVASWQENYDLKLPAPGKKFWAEVEL